MTASALVACMKLEFSTTGAWSGVPAPKRPCYPGGVPPLEANHPMRMISSLVRLACLSALALPACGGSQPPAEEPAPAKSESDEPKKEEEKAEEPKEGNRCHM